MKDPGARKRVDAVGRSSQRWKLVGLQTWETGNLAEVLSGGHEHHRYERIRGRACERAIILEGLPAFRASLKPQVAQGDEAEP